MTDTPKFCKDCKHFVAGDHKNIESRLEFSRCQHPDVMRWNSTQAGQQGHLEYLVRGELIAPYCAAGRSTMSPCGHEGKLFEERGAPDVRIIPQCPVCRQYHPADVACKPGELRDNGPQTFSRNADPWTW